MQRRDGCGDGCVLRPTRLRPPYNATANARGPALYRVRGVEEVPPLVVKPSGVTEPLDVAKFGRGWSGGAVADNTIEVTAIDMLGLPSSPRPPARPDVVGAGRSLIRV